MPDGGAQTDVDADHVARMAPIRFVVDRFFERVHRVENHQIGAVVEFDHCACLGIGIELVLAVGGVDERFAVFLETVTAGIAGMRLELRFDSQAIDLIPAAGVEMDKADVSAEPLPWNRKARTGVLPMKSFLQHAQRMAAVNANDIS